MAALLTSGDLSRRKASQAGLPATSVSVLPFAGDLIRVSVEGAASSWPADVRLGFIRKDREPEILIRSPMIDRDGDAVLHAWVPKAAFELRLLDETGRLYRSDALAITSVRAVSLVEAGLRAFLMSPRKLLAVARLFLAGNHRGVAFRFARLADELNALPYRRWLARHRAIHAETCRAPPKFKPAVLVTLDEATAAQIAATEASLRRQNWAHWKRVEKRDLDRLRSADSTSAHDRPRLWLRVPAGGVLADNAIEKLAAPFATYEVSAVYADEDRIGIMGRRHSPFLKPAWSPLLAQSGWLPVDGAMVRLSSVPAEIGIETADAAAVLTAVAAGSDRAVRHLPQVLLSRRIPRRPTRQPAKLAWTGSAVPEVTVIIPIRDRPDLLSACIDGLLNRTAGAELDIVIVDNDSGETATLDLLRDLEARGVARTLPMPGTFNFSRACNLGVVAARCERILMLNNDVDPIEPGWLEQMCAELEEGTVGAVGAFLFYPDGFVQHAGVTLGAGTVARHSFAFIHPKCGEDHGLLLERRDVSAVTAACLLTRKSLWEAVGGMDERDLAVTFNDVDYCLKLRQAGKRIVWTPHAKLWHRESVSRGKDDTEEKLRRFAHEEATMTRRWGPWLKSDPFHNPNLSKVAEDFVLEAFPGDLSARSASLT